jgi:HEAT repeat protein
MPGSKVAAATFIGEMGTVFRTGATFEPFGLARSLAPDLARLTRDPHPAVRQAAARALGTINPDPQEAIPALQRLLMEKDVGVRRAAAEALPELVITVVALNKKAQQITGSRLEDVFKTTEAVVKTASKAALDADTPVRRAALDGMKQSAMALNNVIPDPVDFFKVRLLRDPFPRYLFGRPTPQQSDLGKEIKAVAEVVRRELAFFLPLAAVLADQGPVLADRVQDEDARARLLSLEALEFMASARQRLRRLQGSVPPLILARADDPGRIQSADLGPAVPGATGTVLPVAQADDGNLKADPLLKGVLPGRAVIGQALADQNPQVRLKAAEFLEMLDEDARPAVPSLIRALSDPDAFVRWATARTLGHVAPVAPAKVVPALARAMADPDPDARMAVTYALEQYRQEARVAVPALAQATQQGDAEARVAAIQALPLVVNGGAMEAVDAVAATLRDRDVRVRRAAAEALGNIQSKEARRAIPALQAALNDSDEDVRRLASESLLTIRLETAPGAEALPRPKGL